MKSTKYSTRWLWLLPLFATLWVCASSAHTAPRKAPELAFKQVPVPTAEFYVTITGSKQGQFHGEGTSNQQKGKIPGLRFEYEVLSPRDAASGLPTGKRQHKPIVITKEWGAATPQIINALVTNENLKQVVIQFYRHSADGRQEIDHTITLTNASVADFKQYANAELHDGSTEKLQMEDVALTFEKIEFKDNASGLVVADDWNSGNL